MGCLPQIVEDCFGVLRLYSDGSVHRADVIDFGFMNTPVQEDRMTVAWKDCLFDKKNNLHLRLYKPTSTTTATSTVIMADTISSSPLETTGTGGVVRRPLPVVYYLHGGGFCVGSRTWPNCHNCCLRLCSQLQAIVVAPDYRLAPEYRLPAALEDSLNAVKWLQNQCSDHELATAGGYDNDNHGSSDGDEWLTQMEVDFDRVFIIGDSSGGNIAHHLAVQLGSGSPALSPVKVRGYVLLAPFFGGEMRTKSEAEGPPEPHLSLDALDRFWRLSLPIEDQSRDHPLANPFGGPHSNYTSSSSTLRTQKLDPILVMVGSDEILKDRVKDYSSRMKELGKLVHYVEFKDQQHGFFSYSPYSPVADDVIRLVNQFIASQS